MKLNVKLLRKIQKHILAKPSRLDMGTPLDPHGCQTVGCIAGWAHLLSGGSEYEVSDVIRFKASKAIGIPNTDLWSGNTLFSVPDWPGKFRDRYNKSRTARTTARITAARIEHLIKTGE